MALSYNSVLKAQEVFRILKQEIISELLVPSVSEDMAEWSEEKKINPKLNVVLGWGKKPDGGWESYSFFIENPSEELIDRFDELKSNIHNSCINEAYHLNKNIWCIGWY